MPNGPLTLEITWQRDGKVLDRSLQLFFTTGRGRFLCGFCGTEMTGKALMGHWFKCAVEFGELIGDDL